MKNYINKSLRISRPILVLAPQTLSLQKRVSSTSANSNENASKLNLIVVYYWFFRW